MHKKLTGIVAVLVLAVLFYFLFPIANQPTTAPEVGVFEAVLDVEFTPEPNYLFGIQIDSFQVIEGHIKRNQNLSEILNAHNISFQKIHELAQNSREVFDVRKIAANKKYTLICERDSLMTARALIYEPSPMEFVVFQLFDSLKVDIGQRPTETRLRVASGVIQENLSYTMDELGISHKLTNNFVDVFAWQIDFYRLQKGDRFKVIFEEILVDGVPIDIGDIKAGVFEHFGNEFYAYAYDQGNGRDFFDEEGKSLRKALLKYPLEFTRISSRYSGNRFHPVQKRWKPHLGTDFAAPTGTPIRSVGDGIVLEAKYNGNNGNYVKIKHNSTYSTQYLHMSKIASGLKPGAKVKQGQTIGFVGATGLATGPHLCYRFWKNGVQVDALKVELPPSEPIVEEHREAFNAHTNEWEKALKSIAYPTDGEYAQASLLGVN